MNATPETMAPPSTASTRPRPCYPLSRRLGRTIAAIACAILLAERADARLDRAPRESPPMINLTAGQTGLADDLGEPHRYGVEYRFAPRGRLKLIPAVGASAAASGATFLYTDLRRDVWLTDRWLAIPSFGVGWFQESAELSLGHDLQFRSGLELAYRFANEYRAGVALFHLSNGGISAENPGTESLVFSLCVPVRAGWSP